MFCFSILVCRYSAHKLVLITVPLEGRRKILNSHTSVVFFEIQLRFFFKALKHNDNFQHQTNKKPHTTNTKKHMYSTMETNCTRTRCSQLLLKSVEVYMVQSIWRISFRQRNCSRGSNCFGNAPV